MYKITSPSSKSSLLSSKSSVIPEDPDIPSCREHYFKEERMLEPGSCMLDTLLNIRASGPVNTKIAPNSATEVAVEKQMQPILIHKFITNNTKIIIQRRSPVPSYQEIFGVKPVKEK